LTARAGRVSYQVTATVEPQLVDDFERFMVEDHIPALMATGCFGSAAIVRLAPGRYRMRYEAESRAKLDRYLETIATRVRAEFAARFPSGVALDRETAEVLGRVGRVRRRFPRFARDDSAGTAQDRYSPGRYVRCVCSRSCSG
jgi:hypothetical protein